MCIHAIRLPSLVVYGSLSFTIDGAVLLEFLNTGHKIKHYNPRDYHPDITDVNFEVCEQLFRWLGTHKHGFKHRSYAGYLLKMYVLAGVRRPDVRRVVQWPVLVPCINALSFVCYFVHRFHVTRLHNERLIRAAATPHNRASSGHAYKSRSAWQQRAARAAAASDEVSAVAACAV